MREEQAQGVGSTPKKSNKSTNSYSEFVVSNTKSLPDYSVYLATEAAAAPAHGIFVVYPLRKPDPPHYTGKQPCGLKGEVKGGVDGNFTHAAPTVMEVLTDPKASISAIVKVWKYLIYRAESEAREEKDPTRKAEHIADAEYLKKLDSSDFTLCLGRKFGDGFVGIDTDGFIRGPEWSSNTGYREISSSGTGAHIITRIPPEVIPTGKNKLKRAFEGGDIEIFHGRGNGIAISGRDASAGPIDLDMDSEAGRLVREILTTQRTEATTVTAERKTVRLDAYLEAIERDYNRARVQSHAPAKSDDEVLRILQEERGDKGRRLFAGDASDYGGDESSADQALAIMLIDITDFDEEQTKRCFLQTGLGKRPKMQDRGADDLIPRVIKNAIPQVRAKHNPPAPKTDVTHTPITQSDENSLYTSTIRIPYRQRQQGWETEAAKDAACALHNIMGEIRDIAECGNGVYACRDTETDLWTILTGPEDPAFKRFCGHIFEMAPKPSNTIEETPSPIGLMPAFQRELWDMITVHRMIRLHCMDCGAPLTCIPTLDGYISLSTGERVESPPIYEYHPFRLNLRTDDAVYKPDHHPTGRLVSDLYEHIGEDTLIYLISLIAASISTPPANRRVTVLTGPPRSSKTTLGKCLGVLGLAPPPEIDFGNEVDGKGKFRANLMKYIGIYPVLFVNDPSNPDGNVVKRFCDTTQLYERKYLEEVSVYQRASVVMTMNNAPDFQTSGMEAKIRYCHSENSYIGQEIADAEYMATIASDGSLTDIWQLVIRHILSGGRITITEKMSKYDRMMHSRTNAMNKWLGMCRPSRESVAIHTIYLDYMVYANPESDREEVINTCNLHAKQAKWHPRGGIAGESKHRIVTELLARGFERDKKGRLMYITLPGHETEVIPPTQNGIAWAALGGHLGRQPTEGIYEAEKGIKRASTGHQKGIYGGEENTQDNASKCKTDDASHVEKNVREPERASSKKTSIILSPSSSICDIDLKETLDALSDAPKPLQNDSKPQNDTEYGESHNKLDALLMPSRCPKEGSRCPLDAHAHEPEPEPAPEPTAAGTPEPLPAGPEPEGLM